MSIPNSEGEAKFDQEARAQAEAEAYDDQARSEVDAAIAATEDGRILGVNTRHYPAQASVFGRPGYVMPDGGYIDQLDNPPPTVVVLVQGMAGDYAAYAGHGTAEWVRDHGDKIRFEEACVHFPGGQLKREKYRD